MRLAALILLLSTVAAAEVPDMGRARTHFEAGKALFQLGNYGDALREFQAGYGLVPLRGFLLNIGQTYRKLNEPEQATQYYQRYLEMAPPDDPDRPQVKQILGELAQQRREHPLVVSAPPAPAKKSLWRRTWWLVPVSAVVLTGVGVGLYFGLRPTQVGCSDVSFCVNANR